MTQEAELGLRDRLAQLSGVKLLRGTSLSAELERLQRQLERLREDTTDEEIWRSVELARHEKRPYTLDYVERILGDWFELHGDRSRMDDRAVVAGIGSHVFRSGSGSDELADAIARGEPIEGGIGALFVQFASHPDNDRLAIAACMRARRPPIDPASLAAITCPVLVVLGDKDEAGDPQPLVDAFPDARLVVLRNTEHFGTPRSFAFIDATMEFLGAV